MVATLLATQYQDNIMKRSTANIVREYGQLPGASSVHGVSYDGRQIWFASGDSLNALNPDTGQVVRSINVAADAGTTFDGTHLFQIASHVIQKIDPESGKVVHTIPAPEGSDTSGLAWAEGSLWAGGYKNRKIYEINPDTGAVLRTIDSNRYVTGVTWVEDQLWHGTWENDESELRHIDADSGEVLETLAMPAGVFVSGLESDGANLLFCGGGNSGMIRTVRHEA